MTVDLEPPFGPLARGLLALRDARLRRCHWCGEWAYDRDDCTACGTRADREQVAS